MKSLAPLLCSLLLVLPGLEANEGQTFAANAALSPEMVTIPTETNVIPEPSSTFFAGLGGLAVLFFVLRRRSPDAR